MGEAAAPWGRWRLLLTLTGVALRLFAWYVFFVDSPHERHALGSRFDLSTGKTRFQELLDRRSADSIVLERVVDGLGAAHWSVQVGFWILMDLWMSYLLSELSLEFQKRRSRANRPFQTQASLAQLPAIDSLPWYVRDWREPTPESEERGSAITTFAIHFMSPITMLTCVARSLACVPYAWVLTGWYVSSKLARSSRPMPIRWIWATTASLVSLDLLGSVGLLLVWPLMNVSRVWGEQRVPLGVGLAFTLMCVLYFVFVETDALSLPTDLRPNPGLWWYLSAQTFTRFRGYFALTMGAQLWLYAFPVGLHFASESPDFALGWTLALWCVLQPFPELVHLQLVLSLLSLFPHVVFAQPWFLPSLLVVFVTLSLQPVMLHSWLMAGTGNANYYYFQTIITNTVLASVLVNAAFGMVSRARVGDRWLEKLAAQAKEAKTE